MHARGRMTHRPRARAANELLTCFCWLRLQESGAVRVGDQLVKVQGENVKGADFDEASGQSLVVSDHPDGGGE